ncbi:putative nuclease HARBI1, partial [Tanacetum coccineum]
GEIGVLDGTPIHAVVPVDQQIRYRGRGKGECFQNVLGICDFNMTVMFVWAGWEGIAHDSRVLTEVAFNSNSNFLFPPPTDFRRQRALTKEERFNRAQAQLRNVIERACGVLKAKFPILKQMAPYPFPIQRNVVIACFTEQYGVSLGLEYGVLIPVRTLL